MQRRDGTIVLSASDLMRFQGCAHATSLDLRHLDGEPLIPADDSPMAGLLQDKGHAHENAFLATLKAAHKTVVLIDKDALSLGAAQAATRQALEDGPDYVYQAALADGCWAGFADFLERVGRPSETPSYEVVDTKLKRSPEPKQVLQLALYSDLLAKLQGHVPEHAHVVLGDGRRVTLRLADYASQARHLRRRLEHFIAQPWSTRPEPVPACGLCRWREHCQLGWERSNGLCLVAGMRSDQRHKLEAAGVTTMAALGRHAGTVPGLSDQTLIRLRTQARLQDARRSAAAPAFEPRALETGKGIATLPAPATGDAFFDIEGDPLIDGGLEYLFGVYLPEHAAGGFRGVWAHEREAEHTATRQVLAYFADHLRRHPTAHIYHYGHYELTALQRLTCRHGVGEAILDQLLREGRFVDLYRVVRQSLITSEPGYSLKDLEVFYADARSEAVTRAGDSIVAYERWREGKNPEALAYIRAYNEADCRSLVGLRDWLIRIVRPPDLPWPDHASPATDDQTKAQRSCLGEAEREAVRARLAKVEGLLAGAPAELVCELTAFHRREDKPQWWAMFERARYETDELIEDLDCLGGLEAIDEPRSMKRSLLRTYRYPEQETKLGRDSQVRVQEGLKSVAIVRLDRERREVEMRFGPNAGMPPDRLELIAGGPISRATLREAVLLVANHLLGGGGRYPALEALLARDVPKLVGRPAGAPLIDRASELVGACVEAVCNLDQSYLPIQGPPGTGKTYIASHAILALVRKGRRVAVTSSSHKAIDNVLGAVADRAREAAFHLCAIKKTASGDPAEDLGIERTSTATIAP